MEMNYVLFVLCPRCPKVYNYSMKKIFIYIQNSILIKIPHKGTKGQKGHKAKSARIYRDFWFRRNKGHEGQKGQKQEATVLTNHKKGGEWNETCTYRNL